MEPSDRKTPPVSRSRVGRRQIAVYAPPDLVDKARTLGRAGGMSMQEVLGVAMDDYLDRRGFGRPLRVVRLTDVPRKLRARVRKGDVPTRKGRRLVAGWYPALAVDMCIEFAAELGMRLNEMGEVALEAFCSRKSVGSGRPDPEQVEPTVDLPV